MNFHFPLMPRIYYALAKQARNSIVDVLEGTPALPDNCQWATFLRCHDELTLEMVSEDECQFMWDFYAPQPRMRLNKGIRRRLAPLMQNDRRRIELVYSILFTCIGSPVIYYGDEIGMGDNIELDDRDGLRTPMQWTDGDCAGFTSAPPDKLYLPLIEEETYHYRRLNVARQRDDHASLLNWLRGLIRVRKDHAVLGRGKLELILSPSQEILAYRRTSEQEDVLVVHNLSDQNQDMKVDAAMLAANQPRRLFGNAEGKFMPDDQYHIYLSGYGYGWFKLA